jgi:Ca2+-binding EF-hand superfamily protein
MTTPGAAATSPAPTGSTQALPSRTEPADSAYRTLDPSNRGYLSKSDVAGLEGFSFDQADTNKDGRISKEEFARYWSTKPAK